MITMTGWASFAFNIGAVASSLLAAYYWHDASKKPAPPAVLRGKAGLQNWSLVEPDTAIDAGPVRVYLEESGRRNKTAALWTAAAALLTGVGTGASLFGGGG